MLPFLALLSLTSNLLECHSELSDFVTMYCYPLLLFTKTYFTVLYVVYNRQSAVTLQLSEGVLSRIKHYNCVFYLKFSILLCTTRMKRDANDFG